jgi:hypothetical protein
VEGRDEQEEERMVRPTMMQAPPATHTNNTHPLNFGHNATATEPKQLFLHLPEEHREEVKETGTL